MLTFEHFWKCTPEMYPPPFQISKYATVDLPTPEGWKAELT